MLLYLPTSSTVFSMALAASTSPWIWMAISESEKYVYQVTHHFLKSAHLLRIIHVIYGTYSTLHSATPLCYWFYQFGVS